MVCSATNRNNGRTAWDAKDEIIGRVLQKVRQDDASTPESLELVEIKPLQTNASDSSGIRLLIDGIEITVAKGFDGTTLSEVLNLLKRQSCSASAAR